MVFPSARRGACSHRKRTVCNDEHDRSRTAASVADLTLEEKASLTSGASFWYTKAVDRLGIPPSWSPTARTDSASSARAAITSASATACRRRASRPRSDSARRGTPTSRSAWARRSASSRRSRTSRCCSDRASTSSDRRSAAATSSTSRRTRSCRAFSGAALVRGIQAQGVGYVAQALRREQPGERPNARASTRRRRARPARDLPARLPARGRGRSAVDPHVLLQPDQRRLRVGGPVAAHRRCCATSGASRVLVVSDWGAVNDASAGLAAGMDLEMPASGGVTDAQIVAAVQDGSLDEGALDVAAGRVVDLVRKSQARPAIDGPLDVDAHHALAREAAGRSIVLLKNDNDILPLSPSSSVAVIGALREEPRYQGAGSSKINPTRLDNALDAIMAYAGADNIVFAQGYLASTARAMPTQLRAEAVELAGSKDESRSSSSASRRRRVRGLRPRAHRPAGRAARTARRGARGQPEHRRRALERQRGCAARSPTASPRSSRRWLLGQAGGSAIADVLYGDVNPSAKLTETIPLRLEDTAAFLNFPGERHTSATARACSSATAGTTPVAWTVALPLRPWTLVHDLLVRGCRGIRRPPTATSRCGSRVTNTGDRDGREVVQVYTSLAESSVQRPVRELKAFAKRRAEGRREPRGDAHRAPIRSRLLARPRSAGSSRAATTRSTSPHRAATCALQATVARQR